MTKAEAAAFLTGVIRAKPANLDGQEHLVQESLSWVDGDGNARTRLKLLPKSDCIAALAQAGGLERAGAP